MPFDRRNLIAYLHQNPRKVGLYAAEVQRIITDLQQETFQAKNEQEKVALASLELRARLANAAWNRNPKTGGSMNLSSFSD